MKILRKIIPALAVSLTCFGCNNNKIKIALNSGIGLYSDSSSCKVITINKGACLSEICYEKPILVDGFIEKEENKTVTYWADQSGNAYTNYVFDKDTILYAHYYNSIEEEKRLALQKICDTYKNVIMFKHTDSDYMEKLDELYALTQNIINESNSSYELLSVSDVFDYIVQSTTAATIEYVQRIFMFAKQTFNYIKKMNTDQRCMSYTQMIHGISSACVIKPDLITIGGQTLNLFDEYANNLSPNFASYYGIPVDSFIRACGQQESLKDDFLTIYKIYLDGCIKCIDVGQVYAITKPLIAIAASVVMRPGLLPTYLNQYMQLVEEITGVSI